MSAHICCPGARMLKGASSRGQTQLLAKNAMD